MGDCWFMWDNVEILVNHGLGTVLTSNFAICNTLLV